MPEDRVRRVGRTIYIPFDNIKTTPRLRLGVIDTVDYQRGVCSVNMTDGFATKSVVPVNLPYAGKGWGIYPGVEKGSRVIVGMGYEEQAFVVGYSPNPGYLNQVFSGPLVNDGLIDPIKEFPYKVPAAGEMVIQSKKCAWIHMNNEGAVNVRSSSGELSMGVVKDSEGKLILSGTQARSQVKLIVVKGAETREDKAEDKTVVRRALADSNTADEESKGKDLESQKIAEITIGAKITSDEIAKNNEGKEIQCEIAMASGVKIQISEDGKVKIYNGAEPSLTSKPVLKAARNGDQIIIPIGIGYVDIEHPELSAIAAANAGAMTVLGTQIHAFAPFGPPCFFVPLSQVTLKGQIVEGSDTVLIGD